MILFFFPFCSVVCNLMYCSFNSTLLMKYKRWVNMAGVIKNECILTRPLSVTMLIQSMCSKLKHYYRYIFLINYIDELVTAINNMSVHNYTILSVMFVVIMSYSSYNKWSWGDNMTDAFINYKILWILFVEDHAMTVQLVIDRTLE